MYENLNRAFRLVLKLRLGEKPVIVDAYDDKWMGPFGRMELEVRHGGKVIFPRGVLFYNHKYGASDSANSKEHALALLSLAPNNHEQEFFEDYSDEQKAFVNEYADLIGCVRTDRYCDPETGALKRKFWDEARR